MFAKLGRWCFRNRGKVALGWLAVLILGGVLSNALIGTAYSTEFGLPDVESRRGFDILDEHFANSTADREGGTIVFRVEQGVTDPEVQAAMTEFLEEASQIEGDHPGQPVHPGRGPADRRPGARGRVDRLRPDRCVPRHDPRGGL